ncbi:peptide chain release factor N(5)-glutamine methyltransferase [Tropicimonas sediminicola]|uniref:Release factor glutamine methyltransferase n=1 Tax=Tropicimonas sediminicola TaxID=1031541 RepID=A0A239EJA2_9RHOB|nr:peptide chain release factor N(5)-glutamine methyltransferase [Tropicimonas sediminicola]SNS44481.1 [protein release factor]-glutamine N5-methyltransferase [Tropicimonas sediminicola]
MSATFADVIATATARLRAAGVETPERDARRLVAFAAGIGADRLSLHLRDAFEGGEALENALAAREERRPVSHIIGERLFYGRPFRVTADVLDPRPETETLVAAALEKPFERVLDLGSGTGCILLTLLAECPGSTGLGVDASPAALDVARSNAAALGIDAEFRQSDWFGAVTGQFDLIVSNPPYIAAAEMVGLAPETRLWEPRMALTDEADGLSAYRAIAAGASAHLAPGGRLMVEVGATQAAAVAEIFGAAGLEDIGFRTDLDGRRRVVIGNAERP